MNCFITQYINHCDSTFVIGRTGSEESDGDFSSYSYWHDYLQCYSGTHNASLNSGLRIYLEEVT